MTKAIKLTVATFLAGGLASSAWAIPFLQLDIAGAHHYDAATETIIADSNPFDVRALIDADSIAQLSRKYYLSAAITPNPGTANFGSFTLLGKTYNVGNMSYGTPPVDNAVGGIPGHGVFPTYYTELAFDFGSMAHTVVPAYNTADGSLQAGNTVYAFDFGADVSGLASSAYSVHFDLYTYYYANGKKPTVVEEFAPFSHDAQSGTHGVIVQRTAPDGGSTLLLLGSALVGLGAVRRKLGANIA